jgi:C4-dicarboxylate-specific signal transduction histidine kinase
MSKKLITADRQKDELLYSLEAKVQERTAELKQSNSDLETALKKLSKAESSRKQLLTNISMI